MFTPNSEQLSIMDAATTGGKRVIAINALAGTGKTTTLAMLANSPLANLAIHYITFNSRAAAEARQRFGRNTVATTAHSHAWHSYYPGTKKTMSQVFGTRLAQGSLFSEMAQVATESATLRRSFTKAAKALHLERSGWRGGISPLLQVIDQFTKSAGEEITKESIPQAIRSLAIRTHSVNELDVLVSEAQKLWNRQVDPTSTLPISHGLYRKLA
jgi:hypothetical protein